MEKKEIKRTSDYAFIAYLVAIKGFKWCEANKIRRGKMEYGFEISETEWVELRMEFSQSSYNRFFQEIKAVQDPSF